MGDLNVLKAQSRGSSGCIAEGIESHGTRVFFAGG
jgi:hypothetical protein